MKRVGARQAALLQEVRSASVSEAKQTVWKPVHLTPRADIVLSGARRNMWNGLAFRSNSLFWAFQPFPLQLWHYDSYILFMHRASWKEETHMIQAWLLSEGNVDYTCDKTNSFLYLTFFNLGEQSTSKFCLWSNKILFCVASDTSGETSMWLWNAI